MKVNHCDTLLTVHFHCGGFYREESAPWCDCWFCETARFQGRTMPEWPERQVRSALTKGAARRRTEETKKRVGPGGGVLDERNGGRLEVGKVHLPSKPVQRLNIGLWRYKLHIQQTLSHVCHNSTLMPESKHFR